MIKTDNTQVNYDIIQITADYFNKSILLYRNKSNL
jgi:hypothetical protein